VRVLPSFLSASRQTAALGPRKDNVMTSSSRLVVADPLGASPEIITRGLAAEGGAR
jgi:hypothetical protein